MRLPAARLEALTAATTTELRRWRWSPWQHESRCRACLRSHLCLQGAAWHAADQAALAITAEALRRLGASERPSYAEASGAAVDPLGRELCVRCGNPLPEGSSPRRMYCGPTCRDAAGRHGQETWEQYATRRKREAQERRERRMVPCEQCGTPFLPAQAKTLYCSRECKSEAQRRTAQIPCAWCGTMFRPKRAGGRFCSRRCAGLAGAAERVAAE
ncbi:MAG: hypothetical protein AAGE83_02320 [Pseudomonadota bacterium]